MRIVFEEALCDRLLHTERTYTHGLADLAHMRADVHADLGFLGGDLAETVVLCASELHANAARHGRANTPITHVLTLPTPFTLSLTVFNQQTAPQSGVPRIPTEREETDWAWAENRRGLLLVEHLSTQWGFYAWPYWSGLGTQVWATFTLPHTPPRT